MKKFLTVVAMMMVAFCFTGCTTSNTEAVLDEEYTETVLYEKYDLGWCNIHRKGDAVIAEVRDVDYIPKQGYADVIYVAEKYFGEVIDIYASDRKYGLKDRTDYNKKGEKDKRYIIVYKNNISFNED